MFRKKHTPYDALKKYLGKKKDQILNYQLVSSNKDNHAFIKIGTNHTIYISNRGIQLAGEFCPE